MKALQSFGPCICSPTLPFQFQEEKKVTGKFLTFWRDLLFVELEIDWRHFFSPYFTLPHLTTDGLRC